MRLIHPILAKCKQCNTMLNIKVDMECISSYERSMGEEYFYEGIIYENCPICDNEININLSVWEYPIGSVNYHEEKCYGAFIVEGPEYEPFEYDDFY